MVVTSQGKKKEGSTFFRVCCFFTVLDRPEPNEGEQAMVTQQKPEEVAAKGTGLVLLTLASAQFLMTLDSSVMNVSIATVAEDVGTTVTGIQDCYHALHTRDGDPDAHRGQDRGHYWTSTRFLDRLRDLRSRVVHDRSGAEPRHPDTRMVVPGRHWRRADHARS